METEAKSDFTYEYLVGKYGEDIIYERGLYWIQMAKKVIIALDLEDKVYINRRLLIHMLANYFADIQRLKEFHPVESANTIKIFAYSTFWCLRLSPIQLKCEIPNSDNIFINEKLVATVLLGQFLPPTFNHKIRKEYLKELLYFFKYRHYTAQTIEGLIIALMVGNGEDPFLINKVEM